MLIVKPSVELVGANSPANLLTHVELCGRVCYKSEARITDGSAEKFVSAIIKRGHEAVLEHGRISLEMLNPHSIYSFQCLLSQLIWNGVNTYLVTDKLLDDDETFMTMRMLVSGNIRAWRALVQQANERYLELPRDILRMMYDNAAFFPEFVDLDHGKAYYRDAIVNPAELVRKDLRIRHSWYTLRFICDRGISHEIVRHRPASYCQESTRYCNYSKGDFNGQITVIEPCFLEPGTSAYEHWKDACKGAEMAYFELLNDGCSPEQARDVLPTSVKTELVMTATAEEWLRFLELRTSAAAHPQMREIATQAGQILWGQDKEVFSHYGKES